MTVEEKLEKFYQISMEHAQSESIAQVQEYEAALEQNFEEHKAAAERRAAMHRKTEQVESRRLSNMEISHEQLRMKRMMSRREEEMTDRVFAEAEEALKANKARPGYLGYLKKQITEALAFDRESEMRIYIDPSDESLLPELKKVIDRDKVELLVSAEPFLGGTRTVLRSRNILIDNSLRKKLDEIRENYQIREELQHG